MGRQGSQTAMICIYFKDSQQPTSRMPPRTNVQQTVETERIRGGGHLWKCLGTRALAALLLLAAIGFRTWTRRNPPSQWKGSL